MLPTEGRAADANAGDTVGLRDAIRVGLAALPVDLRATIVLRFFADFTVPEIAEAMAIPEGTVKSRLHRAVSELRRCLPEFAQGKFPVHHDRFLLLHWDGTSWRTVRLPFARPPHGIVFGGQVEASGPSDVWVISNGGESGGTRPDGKSFRRITPVQVEHWDGERWESVPAPFGQHDGVSGLSSTSADDAWAVGSYRKAGHSRTLAAHWDGRSWQIAPTPNRSVGSTLTDVVAVRPDDVWAVGESQWLKHVFGQGTRLKEPIGLFEHWDGQRWQIMPGKTPVMDSGTQAIAATQDGTAWAIGSCSYDNGIAHWSGSAWQITPHPPDKFPPHRPGYRLTCSSPGLGN